MESFSCNIATKVLERLASRAHKEIHLSKDVKGELNKFHETLSTITKLLQYAEENQRANPLLLADCFRKLQDVCYDMDDILDEYEYNKLRMQVLKPRGSVKEKVHNLFSIPNSVMSSYKMSHRIKNMRKRLGEIAASNLSERAADWHGMHMERKTSSFVHSTDVIGRDNDKNKMLNHLLKDTYTGEGDDEEENVSIISINGLGGLGKTTLAELAYNDDRVVANFNLRIWICVSDNFDSKRLLRKIVSAATKETCEDAGIEEMQMKLQHALKNKKLLLVLDDVWDKGPMGITIEKWLDFKSFLNFAANGSKIIVTTRTEFVSLLMEPAHVHLLECLPHSDCMTIFKKLAFTKREEGNHPKLMEIGEDIVKKCGGVPLAVQTVAFLLRLDKNVRYWSRVRDNDIWKLKQGSRSILPALKLSYNALPVYLKPCFAFCSLFPKDYIFRSEDLIPLWMAQGFIQSCEEQGNQELEDIGLHYIRQLSSRYLFQIVEDDFPFIGFKMHDLVHDLAISVAKVEYSSMNFRPSYSSKMVRHVSISQNELSKEKKEDIESLLGFEKLRTILIPNLDTEFVPTEVGVNSLLFLQRCIRRLNFVRALDLSNLALKMLPSSIADLWHLRYLDLSFNRHLSKLPDSICKLHHLQSLVLAYCENIQELPKDMGNLINLRYLVLTLNQMHLPEVIGCLTSLQTLFVISCNNLKYLGEGIGSLTNLRTLVISECKNLESLPTCNMTALETLDISDCPKLDLMGSGEGIRGLGYFGIENSSLKVLPHWLQESANTLQGLRLDGTFLQLLPDWFENFTMLEKLRIIDCPDLGAFPEGMHRLKALRELEISSDPLAERCRREEGEDWSKIAHVPKIILYGRII
ncbi:putative disease resistance protein RGA3 [Prunus avium]|uniref:Disease resistance protein RGA3 n=1 Tax=Prunus avium TaxID=42229 RepID=A0A6P5T1Y2_PRUAV|nr:putative disease resistance protein RGA3 [Prunus avium]